MTQSALNHLIHYIDRSPGDSVVRPHRARRRHAAGPEMRSVESGVVYLVSRDDWVTCISMQPSEPFRWRAPT